MPAKSYMWRCTLFLLLLLTLLPAMPARMRAQEPLPQLLISGSDTSSLPSIELHLIGRDGQGNPLDLNATPLMVTHGETAVTPTVAGSLPVGTLTIFLIDVPTGVAAQIPAIQDAIKQFASPNGGMQEQLDFVAVYEVEAAIADPLLAPTGFYNSVQNLFINDLAPETGTTALIDSLVNLLNQANELRPRPNMAVSIVVISDGTDVVSTQYQPEDVIARATALGIPVHTIWLTNADLPPFSQTTGQTYLADVASATRGGAADLENGAGLINIWQRIAAFRDQTRLRYTVDGLSGGRFPVEVSLVNEPLVSARTEVVVVGSMPAVTLNLPADSASLTLPDLTQPVTLRLGAGVAWLDGVQRVVSSAGLVVNGQRVADIPLNRLEQFDVSIDNFVFGANTLAVTITDEQDLQVTSAPVTLTIAEGQRSVPADLQPGMSTGRLLLNGFLLLLVLLLFGVLLYLLWQSGYLKNLGDLLPRGRSQRRRPQPPMPTADAGAPVVEAGSEVSRPFVLAHLEVLEAKSSTPKKLNLDGAVVRIGRSPSQTDIAFREDITMSRLHASLMLEGAHYRIFDEQSTSGTYVNEREAPEYGIQLVDGDEIRLGAVRLRYRQL
jgi:hypothetical protein